MQDNNRGREQTVDEIIDDALGVVTDYTLHVWKGSVTWSKEALRSTLGKWYPVGDTSSLECDVYGCPSADWRIARQWQKTASVTVLNKSQTKDIKQIFDRGDNKCAVLKPIGSGDGVKILKELCLSTRKREGYVKFQSENGKYGFMRIVYFEALQVFMARWPEDQDTLCDSMEKLLKSIEATKKNQQFEKVIKILVCINVIKDQTRD